LCIALRVRSNVCVARSISCVCVLRRAFVCNLSVARSRAIFGLRVRSNVCVARLCIALRVRSNVCFARSNSRVRVLRRVCALRRAFVCMRPRFCSVYRLRRAFVCNVCVARSRAIFTLRVRSKVCVARLCIALRVRSNACVARSNIRAALVRPGDFRAALVRPGALVGPKFEFRNLKILAAFFGVDGKSINYHPDAYTGIDLAGLLSQEFHGIVVKHFVTGKPIDVSVIKRELDSLVVGVVSQRPHADYAKCCSEFNLQVHDACKDECDKLIVALRAWAPGDDVGWGCVSKLEAQIISSGIATCQMTLALASATRRDEMKKATATIDHLQDRLGSIIGIISHASTIMPCNIVRNGKSIPLCDAMHDLVGQVQSEHDAYGRAFDLCSSLVPLLEGLSRKVSVCRQTRSRIS
jgi:hypothetical protein